MSDLNKILLFTFLIPALTINASPIANIEDVRRSNEVGSFRDIEFAFSGTRGNEERDDYDIGIALAKNTLKSESMFLLEKSERTNEDVVEDESFFLHARYLWKNEEKNYNFETYFQSSENPFQSYKKRDLVGFGLRFSERSRPKNLFVNSIKERVSCSFNIYLDSKIQVPSQFSGGDFSNISHREM